ncbi:MAG: DUF4331 domain-containing protein [Ktedonobacteraceae bacterium]
MSSHREAPEILKDPVADNTDVYAFVSPDHPDTVTLIANYIPLEEPDAGPYYYEFGEDVLYEIHIDNDGDARSEITYQFRFHIEVRNPNTFLYNTGPITSLDSPNWNRRQFYSVTRIDQHGTTVVGSELACPPCHVGPHSTPNYPALADAAIHTLSNGERVFAGQRAEGFYVDVGAIFDLLDLRPFQNLHIMPMPATQGINGLTGKNVHTIAIQVPKTHLTRDGSNPTDPNDSRAVIGVYASSSRQKATIREGDGEIMGTGPFEQVSRLANPLFNEVLIPMGEKNLWNGLEPIDDARFLQYVLHPELERLIPALYPGVFPHLADYTKPRVDLEAILLTGIPKGIIPGFQNFTGPTPADLERLNMAIPPTEKPNILGIIGGDLAGFPNGRRVFDDVVTIELRAIAGVTIPLVDHTYKPDAAASVVSDFSPPQIPADVRYQPHFPYLGVPFSGFEVPPGP